MNADPEQKIGTRQRLLEAAAEIYAEQGYKNARVRDICDRAGANIAAVNYHFGDKRALYDEVLRYAFFSVSGADPTAWDIRPEADVGERLHAFITNFLTQLITEGRFALYGKLVARELADPTPALERVIDEGIRPQIQLLSSIIGQALGDAADEQVVRDEAGIGITTPFDVDPGNLLDVRRLNLPGYQGTSPIALNRPGVCQDDTSPAASVLVQKGYL